MSTRARRCLTGAPSAFAGYLDDIAADSTQVSIDRVFGLEEIAEAHRYMESNQATGKLVVVI